MSADLTSVVAPRDFRTALPKRIFDMLAGVILTTRETPDAANRMRGVARKWSSAEHLIDLCALLNVLADLVDQSWSVDVYGDVLRVVPASASPMPDEDRETAKARLRSALQQTRNRQLEEPSVQSFLSLLSRSTNQRQSIDSVITDGGDLSRQLRALGSEPTVEQFRSVIRPEIEICETDARCPDTNIRLLDMWRYFRHGWSTEYRPVPGRAMPILVRNAALKNRPVIGIAMLASPVMKLKARDDWFGYSMPSLGKIIATDPAQATDILRCLSSNLEDALSSIRSDDFLSPEELAHPSRTVIGRLHRIEGGAAEQYQARLRNDGLVGVRQAELDTHASDAEFLAASEGPLFVRKRAEMLRKLLTARVQFDQLRTGKDLMQAYLNRDGYAALSVAMKEALKTAMSSQIMDVSVCGAVYPYNLLLGGKLVAMLMGSEEVSKAYHQRYSGSASVIASQMAGRRLEKSANLRALTTTSLYGFASSQYNRARLQAKSHSELHTDLDWTMIGRTEGKGSIHLSQHSVHLLRQVSKARFGAQRITSRFGEGTSPRLRQIREGLEALGVDAELLLHHNSPRILYGMRLDGCDPQLPLAYTTSTRRLNSSDAIGAAWIRRWALARSAREQTQTQLAKLGPTVFRIEEGREQLDLYRTLPGG